MDIDLTGLVLPERIEGIEDANDPRYARFVIEPLERGYGNTLGHSVRRVLLSSLGGSAVWAFRIDGVVHEHQTIQFMLADMKTNIEAARLLTWKAAWLADSDQKNTEASAHAKRFAADSAMQVAIDAVQVLVGS